MPYLLTFSAMFKPLIDYAKRQETRWDQRCIGIEGMLRHNLLAYTIQPVPYPGRVDFAATFFSRDRLARENVKFGEYRA
jgi:hypothetical protein